MSIKINSLELESVKRIKAVKLEPTENGLTVIGGRNGQGKTSVLDAICWALGGDRYRPSNPKREGDYNDPSLHIELSNGITVERSGKNGTLKVTDKDGNKGGQTLLNGFIEELALNLPKFLESSSSEKASTLLQIIGVGDELTKLDAEEKKLYNERYAVGRMAEQKEKYALELPRFDGVPASPVSAGELIRQQQDILAKNGENQRKRERVKQLELQKEQLQRQYDEISEKLKNAIADLELARLSAAELKDMSTEELEKNIADIDALNIRIRANLDREKAFEDSESYKRQYAEYTSQIEEIRTRRMKLLDNANLPLPELSVYDGELTYKGNKWDCMSGAEQLKVATAIVRKLKPECGFVLLDKLEQMDAVTLREFGTWLESEGLQAIATRVSTGDECSVIIEDGCIAETNGEAKAASWTEGRF